MELVKCVHKVKCDFDGCSNLAEYSFSVKGIFRHELCFCSKCMQDMASCIAKLNTPKSIESKFKLNKRLKKNEE